jgi:hypothetical protein
MNTAFRVAVALTILLALAINADADALSIANAHDAKVNDAIMQCKPQEMIDLYDDHAVAIYPGEGEIARGKSDLGKLVNNFFTAFCPTSAKRLGTRI